jgi:hypothetical protein
MHSNSFPNAITMRLKVIAMRCVSAAWSSCSLAQFKQLKLKSLASCAVMSTDRNAQTTVSRSNSILQQISRLRFGSYR